MKAKNNHARSKQKRKALRLKNRMRSIQDRRYEKRMKELKPKGKTFRKYVGPDGQIVTAKNIAMDIARLFPDGGGGWMFDHNHAKSLNQRQKRKRYRQQPHGR